MASSRIALTLQQKDGSRTFPHILANTATFEFHKTGASNIGASFTAMGASMVGVRKGADALLAELK
ncbi:hypothetical protein HB775_00300 [Rhizobium leguminosarum bv. trifolii]|nr:hypothetical protein HB775_00300 [Rhizobium leguminosarum bv. trifolii]